jgi:uncharacterized protein
MASRPVIWKRKDLEGLESTLVRTLDAGERQVTGCAVFAFEGVACRLDYDLHCSREWVTRTALVTGWIGDREIHVDIERSAEGDWSMDGALVPQVASCSDIDLNFSPSTNLLPIRRLDLEIGASAKVRAAWLQFPHMVLQPLDQTYTRLGLNTFHYEAGTFKADLTVDDDGLVMNYADWTRVDL